MPLGFKYSFECTMITTASSWEGFCFYLSPYLFLYNWDRQCTTNSRSTDNWQKYPDALFTILIILLHPCIFSRMCPLCLRHLFNLRRACCLWSTLLSTNKVLGSRKGCSYSQICSASVLTKITGCASTIYNQSCCVKISNLQI